MNLDKIKNVALLRFFSGSIARRLTAALIVLGITATLITTAVQTFRNYRMEIVQLDGRLENLRTTHGPSLAASVWSFSNRQIDIELQGLLNTPGFEYAEVRSLNGDVWSAGVKKSSDVIVKEFPLLFFNNGKDQTLGVLIVVAGKQAIYDRIKLQALETLIYFGTWTFVLAASLFLIFNQLVTRHLVTLARYTSSISFDSQAPPLVLGQSASKPGSENELEQVANAINSMRTQLAGSILELREGELIRQSEERLRKIFESSPAGIAIVSPETNKRLYLNPAMAELFGASSVDQLMEMDLKQTYANPADLDWLRSKTGDDFIEEAEIERKRIDGTRWWCLLNRRLIEYEGQIALMAWHYDISERKRAEEEIKKLNEGLEQRIEERTRELSEEVAERKQVEKVRERLAQAVESVPVGIALFDSDDRLVFFNSRYEDLMDVMEDVIKPGVSFEELIRTIVNRQPVKDAIGREEEFIRKRVEHHRNPTGPYDIRRENMWLMADETRLPDGSIFTIFTDVTKQKQAEEDRRLALVDAEQANQAKSEFLATMSHELRTPLNAILGFSDILSHQYLGPPGEGKYREYAKDIHDSGEHLLELVNDLLDISTIEAGKQSLNKEMLAVDEVIAESFNALGQKAQEKGIQLITKFSENLLPFYADRRATRQIFLNLLSNAVKFTPEGGKITVSANASKQKTTFQIADTGQGIPAEKLPNLTDPFMRGEQDPHLSVDGWGLGLAITKSLVDLHDGRMDIASKLGKGTTVTVTLPNGRS